ncbi:hypothetical protein [Paenibacillus sp. CMAA1364]
MRLIIGESIFKARIANDMGAVEQLITDESTKIIALQQESHLLSQKIMQIKDEKIYSCQDIQYLSIH